MLRNPNSRPSLLTKKISLSNSNNKMSNFKKQVPMRRKLRSNFKTTLKNNQKIFRKKVLLSFRKSNQEIEF